MTQRVVTLFAVTFLLTFLPASVCTASAQAVEVSGVVVPCREETTPGRPTLKRRVVNAEETTVENANEAAGEV